MEGQGLALGGGVDGWEAMGKAVLAETKSQSHTFSEYVAESGHSGHVQQD